MPRNISFMLTTRQFLDGTKDVTRRYGWRFLKAGDILCAVEKSQGLGKGGKVNRLGMIKVVSVRQEPLRALIDDPRYGFEETTREGFPKGHYKHPPRLFVQFFCESHKGVTPETVITRIEFARLPAAPVLSEAQIAHMVNRFLAWRLPENFSPDAGISFTRTFNDHMPFGPMKNEPTGTNLFDAEQATAMVRHMLEGIPTK